MVRLEVGGGDPQAPYRKGEFLGHLDVPISGGGVRTSVVNDNAPSLFQNLPALAHTFLPCSKCISVDMTIACRTKVTVI